MGFLSYCLHEHAISAAVGKGRAYRDLVGEDGRAEGVEGHGNCAGRKEGALGN